MHTEKAAPRLDTYLVEHGYANTVVQARGLISAGLVMVQEQKARQASQAIPPGTEITILKSETGWASRAGGKLQAALDHFEIDLPGAIVLDCGASTGGFTDVVLERGAAMVYAVDVGYGQLVDRLRTDARVVVMDRTNIRYLTAVPGAPPTHVVMDLSFISLTTVLPAVALLAPGATCIALYKPQFELSADLVGDGGIVLDGAAITQGLNSFCSWIDHTLCGSVQGDPFPSPVLGNKGNQEWLVWFILPATGVLPKP